MIDRVAKHLVERVHEFPTGTWLHRHRLVQAPLGEPREERSALRFGCLPPCSPPRPASSGHGPAAPRDFGFPSQRLSHNCSAHTMWHTVPWSPPWLLFRSRKYDSAEAVERGERTADWPCVVGEQFSYFGDSHRPPCLLRRRDFPGVHHTLLHGLALDLLIVPPASPSPWHAPPGRFAQNAVRDRALGDGAPGLDRHVGPHRGIVVVTPSSM